MDSSWKVQTLNLNSSSRGAGVVAPKITSLVNKVGVFTSLSVSPVASKVSLILQELRKPNLMGISAFFTKFISVQRVFGRAPMNGSFVCAGFSSEKSVRNDWVSLNCSLY